MDDNELTRKVFLAGGLGLISLLGGGWLLKACAPPEEPVEEKEKSKWQPSYARLEESGEFALRVEQAYKYLEDCQLCPRRCRVNRLAGETGFCRSPEKVVVYSHQPHFGEELPLVGENGSGTIFFSNCNLRCVFCQNYPIAHEGRGRMVNDEDLAEMMLDLQQRGCHNINLVTPTHVMPHIINAIRMAFKEGLNLPICYNTSGYERAEMIEVLDGIVDIYLPDMKFMDGEKAERYNLAEAHDYPEMARQSLKEMHRQVGDLVTDEDGIALQGIMVRHLVMPNRVTNPREFAFWVAENLSRDTYVNIMSQYRVEFKAFEYEEISRAITSEEFVEAMEWAKEAGLTNLDERSLSQLEIHRYRMD